MTEFFSKKMALRLNFHLMLQGDVTQILNLEKNQKGFLVSQVNMCLFAVSLDDSPYPKWTKIDFHVPRSH